MQKTVQSCVFVAVNNQPLYAYEKAVKIHTSKRLDKSKVWTIRANYS